METTDKRHQVWQHEKGFLLWNQSLLSKFKLKNPKKAFTRAFKLFKIPSKNTQRDF